MSATSIPRPSALRSASVLAVWSAAVARGAGPDDVIDVFAACGTPTAARADCTTGAEMSGLPGPGEAHAPLTSLLPLLRQGGAARLVLPVPGDMRGLPAGSPLAIAALDAGAAVVLPAAGVSLVPQAGHWRAYPGVADHPVLPEWDAKRLVDDALADAARTLQRADIARAAPAARAAIRHTILAEEVPLPSETPPAASELLAQSITLYALLAVAADHDTAAATAREAELVRTALAPLAAAVRESRRTAVHLAVAALHPAGTAAQASRR